MKTLLILFLTACTASAVQPGDLIGHWSGRFTAREEGDLAASHKFVCEGFRRLDGGVTLLEKSSDGYTTKIHFFKGGKFKIDGGTTSVGKWKSKSDSIVASGKATNPGGDSYSFTVELTMPEKGKFRLVRKVPRFDGVSTWTARLQQ